MNTFNGSTQSVAKSSGMLRIPVRIATDKPGVQNRMNATCDSLVATATINSDPAYQ